jgi:hypothetical protein
MPEKLLLCQSLIFIASKTPDFPLSHLWERELLLGKKSSPTRGRGDKYWCVRTLYNKPITASNRSFRVVTTLDTYVGHSCNRVLLGNFHFYFFDDHGINQSV